jgi:L-arabinose isomerase
MSLRPRIGLLALTLELYETLAPGLRASREAWVRRDLLPALTSTAVVLFEGAVFRRDEVERAVRQFEAAGVDVLVVVLLTYAPSQIALPALVRTRLPIVVWNTQEAKTVDHAFTVATMIDNHGVHGTQDLANVLVRAGVPFHYVTSHGSDPDGCAEVRDFCVAAAAVSRLRAARIGRLGYPFPGMGDFAVDTTQLAATLGCTWVNLTVEDYQQRAAGAPTSTVADLVETYRAAYEVAAEVTPSELEATARAEWALRSFVVEHGLAALTYQFLAFGDDERTVTLPFVAASRLMAEGIGFGGEGDLIGAAGTALLNWLNPPATFSEVFTIDFTGNALFMSHMGEANVAMARRDRRVPLVARPTPITRTRARQLALVTSLEPGPATLVALTLGPAQCWRVLAAPVSVEDYGPLPDFCVPHFKLRTPKDVRQFLTEYANAGGPHHNAVCFGDARRRLSFAARLLGAEYREFGLPTADR